jgi:DDE superfamily endonuclease
MTGQPELLILDTAPVLFDAFKRNGVKAVAFLPPHCTSWKQPFNMGNIAALKKWYKYIYLKNVLSFYDMDK